MTLTIPDSLRDVIVRWIPGGPAKSEGEARAEKLREPEESGGGGDAGDAGDNGPPEDILQQLRAFIADQLENASFLTFSLIQAGALAGLGVLAGRLLPWVHQSASEGLPVDKLALWDDTHHSMGRILIDTFLTCALVLLIIGGIVIVIAAARTFLAFWRKKLRAPADGAIVRKLRNYAWYSMGTACLFAILIITSMVINIVTAWPLAWLLPEAPRSAQIAGWVLWIIEGALLVLGLAFAFTHNIRSAFAFLRRRPPGPPRPAVP